MASKYKTQWVRRYFYVQEDTDAKIRLLAQALQRSEPEILAAAVGRVWDELARVNPLAGFFPTEAFHSGDEQEVAGEIERQNVSRGGNLDDTGPRFGAIRPVEEIWEEARTGDPAGVQRGIGGAV